MYKCTAMIKKGVIVIEMFIVKKHFLKNVGRKAHLSTDLKPLLLGHFLSNKFHIPTLYASAIPYKFT